MCIWGCSLQSFALTSPFPVPQDCSLQGCQSSPRDTLGGALEAGASLDNIKPEVLHLLGFGRHWEKTELVTGLLLT